jgi:tetratricopeptide (TPR) repeat protein
VQEKYARAREELEKARDLFEKDQNWAGYVRAQNGVGAVVLRQGDYKAALEQLNLAMATARARLGPSHPEVARSYQEIGNLYVLTRRSAEGLEALGKALELRRAASSSPRWRRS